MVTVRSPLHRALVVHLRALLLVGVITGAVVTPGAPAARFAVPAAHSGRPGSFASPRDGAGGRAWPVGSRPAVLRGWEPPDSAYGPGHRGVDLAAVAGTPVRAAAAGRVSFAGAVAGRGVLSVTLSGTGAPPLRTTYEPVEPLAAKGDEVTAGQVVATLAPGPFHCREGCLHWGLLRARTYLDPLSLLPPGLLRRGPSRLLPLSGVPEPRQAEVRLPGHDPGDRP